MNIKLSVLATIAFLFSYPNTAFSDSAETVMNKESVKLKTVESVLPELSSSELNAGGSVAYVETGTDKKVAFFRFGDVFEGTGTRRWQLSLEVPYDESNGSSVLGDFDGLADTANIAFTYTKMKLFDRKTPEAFELAREKLCAEYLDNPAYIGEGCVGGDFTNDYVVLKDDTGPCRGITNASRCKQLGNDRKAAFNQALDNLALTLPADSYPEPIRANFWSVEAKVGPENYSFRNPSTLEKESQSEQPWSLSASFNYLKGFTTYGIEFEVQESFKQKPQQDLCEPFETFEGALSCSKARIGAPSEQRRKLLSLKMSHLSKAYSFAIQPKLTYDFEEGEVGIEIPIFLLRSKESQFTGGISVGWQSEDEDVTAGIFIGKAFELF